MATLPIPTATKADKARNLGPVNIQLFILIFRKSISIIGVASIAIINRPYRPSPIVHDLSSHNEIQISIALTLLI